MHKNKPRQTLRASKERAEIIEQATKLCETKYREANEQVIAEANACGEAAQAEIEPRVLRAKEALRSQSFCPCLCCAERFWSHY